MPRPLSVAFFISKQPAIIHEYQRIKETNTNEWKTGILFQRGREDGEKTFAESFVAIRVPIRRHSFSPFVAIRVLKKPFAFFKK